MCESDDTVTVSETLTSTGGNQPLVRAIGGLLTGLVESGCSLTKFKYEGNSRKGFIEYTVKGTAEQVRLLEAATSGWAH